MSPIKTSPKVMSPIKTSPIKTPDSVALPLFFLMWYVGNVAFNKYNTAAVNEVGKESGLTLTISVMQLAACVCWSLLIWVVGYNPVKLLGLQAPERQTMPRINMSLLINSCPLGLCSAVAHNIVKAGEPTFSALVNTVWYRKPPSFLKASCLPIIVGGVAFASLKPAAAGEVGMFGYSLSFSTSAMLFGVLANVAAAFKGGENKRLSGNTAHVQKTGGLGNQFALTQLISFVASVPLMIALEGDQWALFVSTVKTSPTFATNVALSGIMFYVYDELATMTVKATGPVTSSVANTAKRVVVMLYMAAYTGVPLTTEQKQGAAVAFLGVFFYSVVDDFFKPKAKKE